MKFYCLHEDLYEGVQIRLDQLENACKKLNVEFININSSFINHLNLPQLNKSDLLYNSAKGSQTMESLLLNEQVTTFYIKNPPINQSYSTTDWTIIHTKSNLPQPKTIFHLTPNRTLLKNYIDYLGGFPVIIKAVGSTRGIGTIKIESWQNLISTIDYLVTTGDKYILRQFIKAKSGCRMIVLGNEVIAAADFAMNENDFRNAVDLKQAKYFKRQYPEYLKQVAVNATHLANTEFSGVDFLEDENGDYHLLEINFPTGFSGLIDVCEVDIPGNMVEYLIAKSLQQSKEI